MFQEFMQQLSALYCVFSRCSIARGIEQGYVAARRYYMEVVSSITGKVALASDVQSSKMIRRYFVVAIHRIEMNWKKRSAVLNFRYFPPLHNIHKISALLIQIKKVLNLVT